MESPAAAAFANSSEDRQKRYLVAAILASLDDGRIEKLVQYTVNADPDQFRPLQTAIARHSQAATPLLTQIAQQPATNDLPEEEKDRQSRRHANAAVCFFELGHSEALKEALIPTDLQDRRLQTWIIDQFSRASSSDAALREALGGRAHGLQTEPNQKQSTPGAAESRYAQTLIIGDLADRLPLASFQVKVVETLEKTYQSDPDAGVH